MKKEHVITALRAFINQRSGISFADYSTGDFKASREAFNGDYKPMLRHGAHARRMLRWVELFVPVEYVIEASKTAFSGRLTIGEKDGRVFIDYTTGQYFPTEYRNAVCAVLASAIRSFWRDNGGADKIYAKARSEFGRSIVKTWF